MRKLLGIVVLGLLLSGCGGSTYVSNEVTLWQQYKESKSPFKAYGVVHNWKKRNSKFKKEDWSDIQKFAFLLSRLSRIYFRNSEQYGGYKVQSDNDSSQKLYNNKLSLTLDGGLLLILIVLSCIAVL